MRISLVISLLFSLIWTYANADFLSIEDVYVELDHLLEAEVSEMRGDTLIFQTDRFNDPQAKNLVRNYLELVTPGDLIHVIVYDQTVIWDMMGLVADEEELPGILAISDLADSLEAALEATRDEYYSYGSQRVRLELSTDLETSQVEAIVASILDQVESNSDMLLRINTANEERLSIDFSKSGRWVFAYRPQMEADRAAHSTQGSGFPRTGCVSSGSRSLTTTRCFFEGRLTFRSTCRWRGSTFRCESESF